MPRDAAALFETIIIPGAMVLAGAFILLLIYAWYSEKQNRNTEE